jgi:hypothetical protein
VAGAPGALHGPDCPRPRTPTRTDGAWGDLAAPSLMEPRPGWVAPPPLARQWRPKEGEGAGREGAAGRPHIL